MNESIDIFKHRLLIIKWAVIVVISIILLRLSYINIFLESKAIKSNNSFEYRNDILDRNGNVLALNVPIVSVSIHPNKIADKQKAIDAISKSLSIPKSEVAEMVNSAKSFVWVKRNITKKQELALKYYGIIGINFPSEQKRFYPYGSLFSHVVGLSDIDGNGVSGVEKSFNQELFKHPVSLSLDLSLQQILYDGLYEALIQNQAKAVYGIIVNPKNFEVLAMVSLPDYNPNYRSQIKIANLFNYVSQGVIEPGSISKIFTMAMALESGQSNIYDSIDVSKPIVKSGFIITDFSYMDRELILPEVLMYSSNIGSALLIAQLGARDQKKYFNQFRLFDTPKLEIPEVENPIVKKDVDELSAMVMSYGYGYAVSPLAFINSFSAMINGGYYQPLTLLKNHNIGVESSVVLSKETSRQLRAMLRLTTAGGFGAKANVIGYSVAGKTGSAEKQVNGIYDKNKGIASFVGFFPVYDPQYVILISIDEPKRNKYNSYNITGGILSAPVAKNVIEDIGSLYGLVKKDDGLQYLDKKNKIILQEYVENMPDIIEEN